MTTGIIAAIFTFVAAVVPIITSWKKSKRKWSLIVLGGVILGSSIVSIVSSYESQKDIQGVMDSLSSARKETQELTNEVTGGDSYCSAYIQQDGKSDQGEIYVYNLGNYQLPHVQIFCTDYTINNTQERNNRMKTLRYDNFPASSHIPSGYFISMDKTKGVDLYFQFNYGPKKGLAFETLRMIFVKDKWAIAEATERNGRTTYNISSDFPEQDPKKAFLLPSQK
ncbi:MAG: hypothetical protein ABI663_04870 [Chryseolinea sp.]